MSVILILQWFLLRGRGGWQLCEMSNRVWVNLGVKWIYACGSYVVVVTGALVDSSS